MNLIIADSEKDFAEKSAELYKAQLKEKPNSVLGFATGSTPIPVYKELSKLYKNGEIDFKDVTTFNLDEYVGLKPDHPCSYQYFMFDNLFSHINVPKDRIHLPNGVAADLTKECADYEKMIKAAGYVDLQIVGIGHDGHVGFNEPQTPFESETHVVSLTQMTINANSRFFDNADQVPKKAISMGIKTVMNAKKILMVVTGEEKAEIIYKALFGPVTKDISASALQLHPNLTVVLDKAAAKEIVKNVKL